MKRVICTFCLFLIFLSVRGQNLGIKTNVLYDVTTTLNIGTEIVLFEKISWDISVSYNPWEFSKHKRMRLWLLQPEIRYWTDQMFNKHFLGLHINGGQYNFSGINFSEQMKKYNYQGDFYGAGITYGYQWVLSDKWRVEASIGLGYVHSKYDKYPCAECGERLKSDNWNYWGPTKIGVSFIYFIL